MTTTPRPTTELFDGARRARALRWLLKLRTAHHLPMPKRIDFGQLDALAGCRVLRYLVLELDHDTDVTGWAEAVNADVREELPVTSATHTWTYVIARTAWRGDEPRVDWHRVEVSSNHHYRPRTGVQVVTA